MRSEEGAARDSETHLCVFVCAGSSSHTQPQLQKSPLGVTLISGII